MVHPRRGWSEEPWGGRRPSLRPLLERHSGSRERFAYAFSESEYARDYQRTIATARYKLIYVPDEGERRLMTGSVYELYDLDADPGETRNLVALRPELVDRLARELSGFVRRSRRSASSVSLAAWGPERRVQDHLRALGYVR